MLVSEIPRQILPSINAYTALRIMSTAGFSPVETGALFADPTIDAMVLAAMGREARVSILRKLKEVIEPTCQEVGTRHGLHRNPTGAEHG